MEPLDLVHEYVNRVNNQAMKNMEKTGQVAGAHWAAMQSVLAEMEQEWVGRRVVCMRYEVQKVVQFCKEAG